MILSFINIRTVPREMLKTALGFQHLPRDLANVNEWNIMFDPYINSFNPLTLNAHSINQLENKSSRKHVSSAM